MQMIREKLKGHKPIIAAAPERGNVINLMDALKASLGEAKPAAKSKAKAAPPKESAAKASLKAALAASKAAAPKGPQKRKPDLTCEQAGRAMASSAPCRPSPSAWRRGAFRASAGACIAISPAARPPSCSGGRCWQEN